MSILENINQAADYIQKQFNQIQPQVGIVLGSGLGALAEELDSSESYDVEKIPHWPVPTVSGHRGRLVFGKMNNIPVVIQQGRVHYYEGHPIQDVVFPVRVLWKLGIKTLILTNAAGGLNPQFKPGDLMLITDHLNLMFTNPLIGPNEDEMGLRFPDMSTPYHPDLIRLAEDTAADLKLPLQKGILAATTGPSYETAAEVRMMQKLGGDAVCMSTIPEAIAASHLGLKVLGISCITNPATGQTAQKLTHHEVEESASRISKTFIPLLKGILNRLQIMLSPSKKEII